MLGEVPPVLQEPAGPLGEARKPIEPALLDEFHGEERDDAHDGPKPERHGLPLHQELVVVEAVLLVPQARASEAVRGIGDGDKMLEEL